MKKLFLTLGLASLFMVACNNTPKQEEQPAEQPAETTQVVEEEHNCPMHALKEAYADWENMTDEAKAELNKKAVEIFTAMDAEMEAKKAEMEAAGEQVCKGMAEMTEEQKAECEKKCAEMKAAWENFANLNVEEQKDLIMGRMGGCNHGDKPCCNHEGEHKCNHEGEEGHKCEHAAE